MAAQPVLPFRELLQRRLRRSMMLVHLANLPEQVPDESPSAAVEEFAVVEGQRPCNTLPSRIPNSE
ncbi:hypothetical protein E2562_026602 [Oryza meyeriana var. granulata]|uniref:Uncharacterized protein n=1 Tax=Oryza meyeriana var. granulata TaxID=110450 RepID=A0A6G1CT06_9ORYZ|nr:hypothetical protein E2562_026602 [Oryza meyeriana var. granulata]